jgi:hypothetical protein
MYIEKYNIKLQLNYQETHLFILSLTFPSIVEAFYFAVHAFIFDTD